MKTFSVPLEQATKIGLRRDYRSQRNQPQFTSLVNMKPTQYGLMQVPLVNTPIVLPPELSVFWPLPQLFRGQSYTLLADHTALFQVNEDSWALKAVESPGGPFPVGNGPWHLADFGRSWLLTNGVVTSYAANQLTTTALLGPRPDFLYQEHYVTNLVNSVCAFRGRALYGLSISSDLFDSVWAGFLSSWQTHVFTNFNWTHLQPRFNKPAYILWSGISSKLLWPFESSLINTGILPAEGAFDTTRPEFFEWLFDNDLGIMPMPWQGSVLCVLPLENAVIVYGSGGIAALVPVLVDNTTPTFGLKKLLDVGIASRSAVGGDEKRHVFVTNNGDLWTVDLNLQVERLGYREFFDSMLGKEIVVSFDPAEREFYIADGEKAFLLTPTGLCEQSQILTSFAHVSGGLVGLEVTDTGARQGAVSLQTDVLDFGNRDIKRVSQIEVGMTGIADVECQVLSRMDGEAEFFESEWRVANASGVCVIPTSGVDLMVGVRGTIVSSTPPPKIDYVTVHYQQQGKRFIRGLSNVG